MLQPLLTVVLNQYGTHINTDGYFTQNFFLCDSACRFTQERGVAWAKTQLSGEF